MKTISATRTVLCRAFSTARHMTSRRTLGTALITLALAMSGCASISPAYHQYFMQGQVLAVGAESLVVCIGKRDGAHVGQELSVVRHVLLPPISKAGGPGFRREAIGKVRITVVFDDHYASARVLDGSPQINDVVELDRK